MRRTGCGGVEGKGKWTRKRKVPAPTLESLWVVEVVLRGRDRWVIVTTSGPGVMKCLEGGEGDEE